MGMWACLAEVATRSYTEAVGVIEVFIQVQLL